MTRSTDRRTFLKASSAAAVGLGAFPGLSARGPAARRDPVRIALVGCGGRGTGALAQALKTEGDVKVTALGDVFKDRIERCRKHLTAEETGVGERVALSDDTCFVGFDAFEKVLATDVDLVILATPPHFRPAHFKAAIEAGKHVFMEKPVAVDGAGVRTVLAAADVADQKKLAVGVGLQRHHQAGYIETMRRVHEGAIGDIVAARAYWNMGSLWMHPRKEEWSDMEWQLRNWLYFTWLSGDHIVEQHIHNLDVVNWAKGKHPVRAHGIGGRQVRTDGAFGHIFDHHGVHYEYDDGTWMFSQCRQIPKCHNQVSEHLIGTEGERGLPTRLPPALPRQEGGLEVRRRQSEPVPAGTRRSVPGDPRGQAVQRGALRCREHADRDHGADGDLFRQDGHVGAGAGERTVGAEGVRLG